MAGAETPLFAEMWARERETVAGQVAAGIASHVEGEDHRRPRGLVVLGCVIGSPGGGGTGLGRCTAYLRYQSVSIAANTATTLPLDVDEFDPDGWHDADTASPYIVVPDPGDYLVSARFAWTTEGTTTFDSGTYRRLEVRINGGADSSINIKPPAPPNTYSTQTQEIAYAVTLPADAQVYLRVQHNGDGPFTYHATSGFRPLLSVTKIG